MTTMTKRQRYDSPQVTSDSSELKNTLQRNNMGGGEEKEKQAWSKRGKFKETKKKKDRDCISVSSIRLNRTTKPTSHRRFSIFSHSSDRSIIRSIKQLPKRRRKERTWNEKRKRETSVSRYLVSLELDFSVGEAATFAKAADPRQANTQF